jgi:lipopolysaccharide export system permease protein
MRTITRYILAEFFKVFLVTLSSLTLLMVIVLLGKEALDQGLGLPQVIRLIPFILPNALLFTVPGTTLFAVSVVYGRMSSSNEIVAAKSVGIHPMELLWPCIYAGIGLSAFTLWVNDLAWSWGYHGIQRVVIEAGEEIAYSRLRTQRSFSSKQFSINVKNVEDRRLIQPVITFYKGDRGSFTITADEAELRSDLKNDVLMISCRNCILDIDGNSGQMAYLEQEISLKDVRQKDASDSPSHLTMARLSEAREKAQAELADLKQQLAIQAAMQMLSGDFDGLTDTAWLTHGWKIGHLENYLCRVRTEPFRRCANGFSCLCFVLVGAPVAIRLRNSDFITSFFACFLPILVLYYPLLMFGIDRAKNGILPPHIVWLGNLILALIGVWQMRKVIRY